MTPATLLFEGEMPRPTYPNSRLRREVLLRDELLCRLRRLQPTESRAALRLIADRLGDDALVAELRRLSR